MQSPNQQFGLSLIELMIGLLLSSILILGLFQVFASNRSTNNTQAAFSRVQESGRFALDLLSREIRMADYWGCAPDQESIANHLDGSQSSPMHNSIGAAGIQGLNNAGSGDKVNGIDVIEGTDILILSGSSDACAGSGRLLEAVGGVLQVTSNCPLEPGQVVLVSNCLGGDVMTVTAMSGSPGEGSSRSIYHSAGIVNENWIPNINESLSQVYGADSKLLHPYRRTYFLSATESGSSSLFVYEEGDDLPKELTPGIEDMRVLYGRDTNGDGIPNLWQQANNSLTQMAGVVSIKIQLVSVSDIKAGVKSQTISGIGGEGNSKTYTDGHLRKLYTTTVKVRNRGSM